MKINIKDYIDEDDWHIEIYKCLKCQKVKIIRTFNFCPMCNEKIEWVSD